jgi:hypothetical protein
MTTSRRESSLRAKARALFEEAAAQAGATSLSVSATTPLPNPPPQGGREQTEQAAREQTEQAARGPTQCVARAEAKLGASLSDASAVAALPPSPSLAERVRALYEESVVPVREIARLAGVTERTIYKYARKERWTARVTRLSRDGTAAGLPARGAGARFIPREEAGKPVATGLKATDPAGAERAAAACVRAGELSDAAVAQAESGAQSRAARAQALRDRAAYERTLELLAGAFVDLMRFEAGRPEPMNERGAGLYALLANAILCQFDQLAAPAALSSPALRA